VGPLEAERPRSPRGLVWFNAVLETTAVIPCCFIIHFPFLVDFVLRLDRRRVEQLPEGTLLTPIDILGVPFTWLYAIQLALIGLPALIAAVLLWRKPNTGWWFALVVLLMQGLFIATNLACLLLDG
jgi:hypothetical protein